LFLAMTSFAHAQCQEQSFDLAPDWNAIYSPVDSTHSGIATLAASTQVQEVFPDVVSEGKTFLSINYNEYSTLPVKGIQELREEKRQQLAEKTRRVDGLEGRSAKLEKIFQSRSNE
jgi:hypothetical protein